MARNPHSTNSLLQPRLSFADGWQIPRRERGEARWLSRLAYAGRRIRQMRKRFSNLIIANVILFFAISADAQFGFGKPKSGLATDEAAQSI